MKSLSLSCSALVSLALLLAPSPAAQRPVRNIHPMRVWTVDAAGGSDFADLPEAVRAAHSGDVLLVAPGAYSAFTVRGKGLSILGDGGVPDVDGVVEAVGIPAGEVLVLRGLEVEGDFLTEEAMRLRNVPGTVWIEECTLHQPLGAGISAIDCASVVLVRTTVPGVPTLFLSSNPDHAALHAVRSGVHAYESTLEGVDFVPLSSFSSIDGGSGAVLEDSFLFASCCTFAGGDGTDASCFDDSLCIFGASGGAGLDAAGAGVAPITLTCTFQGGAGGSPIVCGGIGCAGGARGPKTLGSVSKVAVPARSYAVETPVRGTSYQVDAACQPGEFVWSIFSTDLDPTYVPLYFGTQIGAFPVTLVSEGVADATGTFSRSVPVPPLALLVPFERLYAQGLFFDALGNAYLGSPSVLVLLN